MPQDIDGSGLVPLLWAAWIYWWVYRWLDDLSSPEQHCRREHDQGGSVIDADTTPLAADAGASQSIDAIVLEILRRDGSTTLDDFLADALATYETIIAAFDAGDLDTLRTLVSPDVYRAFCDAISSRASRQESLETVFSQIDPPEIVGGAIDGTHMEVSVRFAGESFKLARNVAGQIVSGQDDRRWTVDIWTFERTSSSRAPGWRLATTEVGA